MRTKTARYTTVLEKKMCKKGDLPWIDKIILWDHGKPLDAYTVTSYSGKRHVILDKRDILFIYCQKISKFQLPYTPLKKYIKEWSKAI